MSSDILKRDQNSVPVLGAITDDSAQEIRMLRVNPTTGRLLITGTGGGGITSINSDTTAAQIIAAGTGITVTDNGTGTHTIAATGGTGTVTSVGALTLGTTGSDLSSTVANSTTTPVITLNVPTASASNRGALSSTDWSTFNGKASALSGTISTIAYWNSGTTISSLALVTYPSLTEISYVKGVTSAIQTQINAKGAGTVTAVSVATANGVSGSSSGGATPALTITLGAITPTTVNGNTITTGTGTLTLSAGTTLTGPASSGTAMTLGNTESVTGAKTFTKIVNVVTAMGAQALDGSTANIFTRTLAASETFTQSNFSTGQCFMVEVKQGSGTSYTVTWFSGITWVTSGGTAPTQTTTTNGFTTYGFRCTGSNTFLGYLIGSN